MKFILPYLFLLVPRVGSAQPLKAADSVIYKGDSPYLFFRSSITGILPRYNYTIFNGTRQPLLYATARKYEAPVPELRPFYYYTISFPDSQDSLAVFFNGGLFIDTLTRILDEYQLVDHEKIDTKGRQKFLSSYDLQPITAKLAEMQEYLDRTRWLSAQIQRDRTKPITIKNDKLIFQDGVQIGYIQTDHGYNTPIHVFLQDNRELAVRAFRGGKGGGGYLKTMADERERDPFEIPDLPWAIKKKKAVSQYQALIEFLVKYYYL